MKKAVLLALIIFMIPGLVSCGTDYFQMESQSLEKVIKISAEAFNDHVENLKITDASRYRTQEAIIYYVNYSGHSTISANGKQIESELSTHYIFYFSIHDDELTFDGRVIYNNAGKYQPESKQYIAEAYDKALTENEEAYTFTQEELDELSLRITNYVPDSSAISDGTDAQ